MKNELKKHFAHFWRVYRAVCGGFDKRSWETLGYGLTQPNRLALHLLQSTIYYVGCKNPLTLADGSSITKHAHEMEPEDLLDPDTILLNQERVAEITDRWINEMDLAAENKEYPWTGDTAGSVVLFALRHNDYHLGEMTALLNEQKTGEARDNFASLL